VLRNRFNAADIHRNITKPACAIHDFRFMLRLTRSPVLRAGFYVKCEGPHMTSIDETLVWLIHCLTISVAALAALWWYDA
jgi:hypothetical protein